MYVGHAWVPDCVHACGLGLHNHLIYYGCKHQHQWELTACAISQQAQIQQTTNMK